MQNIAEVISQYRKIIWLAVILSFGISLNVLASGPEQRINQLISSAITEKISAIMTEEYLRKRIERANPKDMDAVLMKVADRKPLEGDEL